MSLRRENDHTCSTKSSTLFTSKESPGDAFGKVLTQRVRSTMTLKTLKYDEACTASWGSPHALYERGWTERRAAARVGAQRVAWCAHRKRGPSVLPAAMLAGADDRCIGNQAKTAGCPGTGTEGRGRGSACAPACTGSATVLRVAAGAGWPAVIGRCVASGVEVGGADSTGGNEKGADDGGRPAGAAAPVSADRGCASFDPSASLRGGGSF